MKFLCLHGNGTNSNVMKLQTAPLRHELEDGHEYEFVEAATEAPMSEGVDALSSPDDHFFAFFDPDDLSTLSKAIALLDIYVTEEGPFDAIMGFSAGAVLAASYLVEKQRQGRALPFSCGVFLSSASSAAEMRHLGEGLSDRDDTLLRLPTAHIWGSADETAPTGGADLARLFDPTLRETLVHDGGHQMPRFGHLTASVHAIRRTVFLAREGRS